MPKKKPAPQHDPKGSACAICKGIPDYKFVETLHTNERLPEEVAQLLVMGGYGLYGSEQVRINVPPHSIEKCRQEDRAAFFQSNVEVH